MGNTVKMETSVRLGLEKAALWAPNTFVCILLLLTFHLLPFSPVTLLSGEDPP